MKRNKQYQRIRLYAGRVVLLFGLLSFILTGCKTAKKIETIQPVVEKREADVFFGLMVEKAFQYQTLNARLNAEIKLPEKELNSRVNLKMIRDSIFQLSVQPFLGIEVFRLQVSPGRVLLIDRLNKRYVDELYENIKGKTPVDFNFYNLQSLFTNHLFLPGKQQILPEQYSEFGLDQEGSTYTIEAKDKMGLLYTFQADGEEKLLSTQVRDSRETYSLQWNYADFQLIGSQPFPMRMDVQLLKGGVPAGKTILNYSDVETNTPVQIDFEVPSKYERITIDQFIKSLSKKKK
ncbi:DUF4292 domain-containing protein [Parabacteroides sp. Marseille-P3160]|uniref:DUF4292 domain-containing protein n=1 Tax=Parabacteroides sp. Marseille-P3160 TaxID=1917887 RepID=UPI0009B961E2|nr:DUF4292 domain-containing protein [Parabacteroides sp. Marseille-P3160]